MGKPNARRKLAKVLSKGESMLGRVWFVLILVVKLINKLWELSI